MGSEIAELRERLLLEMQAGFQGLHGYGQVAQHQVIHQKLQKAHRTIEQLEPHIGEEALDIIICDAMELAAQKEQQLKARRREYRLKKQKKRSRRQQ